MSELIKGIRVIYQSTIRLERKQTVYFDPYGLKEAVQDADVIFLTHDHYDHFSPEDIAKVRKPDTKIVLPEKMVAKAEKEGFAVDDIKAVRPGQSYECFGMRFETVPAYNHLKPFHPKHNGWVGYILEWEGRKYYIAGDTDAVKEAKAVRCDVALLPIGGTYTMDPKDAAKLAEDINPQMVIPIHYGCIVGKRTDAELFESKLADGILCEKLMEFGE